MSFQMIRGSRRSCSTESSTSAGRVCSKPRRRRRERGGRTRTGRKRWRREDKERKRNGNRNKWGLSLILDNRNQLEIIFLFLEIILQFTSFLNLIIPSLSLLHWSYPLMTWTHSPVFSRIWGAKNRDINCSNFIYSRHLQPTRYYSPHSPMTLGKMNELHQFIRHTLPVFHGRLSDFLDVRDLPKIRDPRLSGSASESQSRGSPLSGRIRGES
jgi:hypothetical protein